MPHGWLGWDGISARRIDCGGRFDEALVLLETVRAGQGALLAERVGMAVGEASLFDVAAIESDLETISPLCEKTQLARYLRVKELDNAT